jgi:hypothetical protein
MPSRGGAPARAKKKESGQSDGIIEQTSFCLQILRVREVIWLCFPEYCLVQLKMAKKSNGMSLPTVYSHRVINRL